jgi:hypothetical protein
VFPLKDKSSAEITYHFLHGVIARYGASAEVLTDGGGEFQSEFDDLLLKCMIDHRVTSPHHHEANGASERFVKTVKTGIDPLVIGIYSSLGLPLATVLLHMRAQS